MSNIRDVHTGHCCIHHGCKYGDDDCTVTTEKAPQLYPCESCGYADEQLMQVHRMRDYPYKEILRRLAGTEQFLLNIYVPYVGSVRAIEDTGTLIPESGAELKFKHIATCPIEALAKICLDIKTKQEEELRIKRAAERRKREEEAREAERKRREEQDIWDRRLEEMGVKLETKDGVTRSVTVQDGKLIIECKRAEDDFI